ncbi:hypothetical protein L218DRAFT_297929 [Marasmius fiardii PR-910]|nr:hypothetical protein L218DRAFT_297929 [Marasmius fiardii PR-910]
MRQRLDELEETKSTVQTTNAQCRDALSTRRRTPVEIWQMVFNVLCLPLHKYSFCVSRNSSEGCPVMPDALLRGCPAILVSQVCSQWRIIANASTLISTYLTISTSLSRSIYQDRRDVPWRSGSQVEEHLISRNKDLLLGEHSLNTSTKPMSFLWLIKATGTYRK